MEQVTLWDAQAAEAAKVAGMDQAAENKKALLKYARSVAEELAQGGKVISADDVQFELSRRGISDRALGNSAGKLFAEKKWAPVGQTKSIREHSHGNRLTTWRLKGE